uniref:Large ribosomal subunit protein P1 n=1 Tax=Haemonchus placei TaxID=6290 RepID=A0A0N4XBJ9_HAEPC
LLPKQPLIVKAKYFSHEAEDKIKAAGGASSERLSSVELRHLQLALGMALNQEMACVYAALILQDDEVAITGDKIATLLKAANVDFEPFWPGLFAKAVEGVDVKNLITSVSSGVGAGGGAAAPAGGAPAAAAPAAAAPAAETKKKEEPKEESDDDMGFGLFD